MKTFSIWGLKIRYKNLQKITDKIGYEFVLEPLIWLSTSMYFFWILYAKKSFYIKMTFAINCPSIINENATIECSWIGQEMYRQTRNNFLEIVIYNKLVTGQLDHSLNRGCQLSSIMNEYAVNVLKSFFSFQLKKDAYQVRKTWNFVNVSYGKKIMYVLTFFVLCITYVPTTTYSALNLPTWL